MARAYYNASPRSDFDPTTAPKDEIKREFARRLQSALAERGMSQSDLARAIKTGRDNISGYIRGKNLPSPATRLAIAKELGVDPNWLLPLSAVGSVDRGAPAIEMKAGNRDGMVWLRINQHVSMAVAVQIMNILQKDA